MSPNYLQYLKHSKYAQKFARRYWPTKKIRYTEILGDLHQRLQPDLYFEIGIRDGTSLALSNSFSIGVDPSFNVQHPLKCEHKLFKTTSDDFFKNEKFLEISQGKLIDFSFIDGMHLSDYVYRDFINTIQYCHDRTVIIVDDIIPASMEITSREKRMTGGWTGDVYKLIIYLLETKACKVQTVDASPSGLAFLTNFDKSKLVYDPEVELALIGDRYSIQKREDLLNILRPKLYQNIVKSLS